MDATDQPSGRSSMSRASSQSAMQSTSSTTTNSLLLAPFPASVRQSLTGRLRPFPARRLTIDVRRSLRAAPKSTLRGRAALDVRVPTGRCASVSIVLNLFSPPDPTTAESLMGSGDVQALRAAKRPRLHRMSGGRTADHPSPGRCKTPAGRSMRRMRFRDVER